MAMSDQLNSSSQKIGLFSEIIESPEDRTKRLAGLLTTALETEGGEKLRQNASFSSLSLPEVAPEEGKQLWTDCFYSKNEDGTYRDAPYNEMTRHYYRALQKERVFFGAYAKKYGCRLVLHPYIYSSGASRTNEKKQRVLKTRLNNLLNFIKPLVEEGKAEVVLSESSSRGNTTIVGYYFLMKSYSPSNWGFSNTLLNSEREVVNYHIEEMNYLFDKGLKKMIKKYQLPVDVDDNEKKAIRQVSQKSIELIRTLAS